MGINLEPHGPAQVRPRHVSIRAARGGAQPKRKGDQHPQHDGASIAGGTFNQLGVTDAHGTWLSGPDGIYLLLAGSQLGEGVRRYGRQRRRRLRLDEFFFEGSVGPGSVEKTVLLLAAELSGRPAGARRADNRRGTRSFWPLKRGFVRYEGQPAGHREFPRSALPCL